MSILRTIGFYATPPIILAVVWGLFRFFHAPEAPVNEPSPAEHARPPIEKPLPPPRHPTAAVPTPAAKTVRAPAPEEAEEPEEPPTPAPTSGKQVFDLESAARFLPGMVAELSDNPLLRRWATLQGLLPRLVAAMDCIANGRSPRRHLDFAAPSGAFSVRRMGRAMVVDPAAYARYDRIVNAGLSVDPVACATVFRRLEPALALAYRGLGYEESGFRAALGRAAGELLAVPIPEDPVQVRPMGRLFEFADPRLQTLSDAQKHLLRAGPDNARRVQNWIRKFARAINLQTP